MFLPIKVHAVKLAYRWELMKRMPHGYFKILGDKRYVVLSFMPDDNSINSRHPKRYSVTSKAGRELVPTIERYLKIKAEFDMLQEEWNARYCCFPPKVIFPIRQPHDPIGMNNRFFEAAADNTNRGLVRTPVYDERDELRSKNEKLAKKVINDLGLSCKYEPYIGNDPNDKSITPDFLVDFKEIDRCSYVEILGMTDSTGYAIATATKVNKYANAGYRPGREVIYILLYDKYNFDLEYCMQQVMSAFDTMIPNDAIDWGSPLE